MEEDPAFKKMVNRSFILQKAPDLKIPMVKKEGKFKHHAAATLVLSSCIQLLIYPFDTIKTRLVAKNRAGDYAHFVKNRVAELPVYMGIMRGYGSILIGNMCHLTIGRESIALAAVVEGLLKTFTDMTKISKQMGNPKADMKILKKTFGVCAFYGILRDLSFRMFYVTMSSHIHKQYIATSKFFDQRKRVNNIFLSVILATLISQPFEVCFLKAATQKALRYTNILKIPSQIVSEEGWGKLFVGGLWPRLVYNILSTMILVNTYDKFLEASMDIF